MLFILCVERGLSLRKKSESFYTVIYIGLEPFKYGVVESKPFSRYGCEGNLILLAGLGDCYRFISLLKKKNPPPGKK